MPMTELVWRQCVCDAWYWGAPQTDADKAHSRIEAEAAAGPRDEVLVRYGTGGVLSDGTTNHPPIDFPRGLSPDPNDPADIDAELDAELGTAGIDLAAGPRDVPTLPPPDPSLIDTLGEGADPNRPVRVLADHYPTIKP